MLCLVCQLGTFDMEPFRGSHTTNCYECCQHLALHVVSCLPIRDLQYGTLRGSHTTNCYEYCQHLACMLCLVSQLGTFDGTLPGSRMTNCYECCQHLALHVVSCLPIWKPSWFTYEKLLWMLPTLGLHVVSCLPVGNLRYGSLPCSRMTNFYQVCQKVTWWMLSMGRLLRDSRNWHMLRTMSTSLAKSPTTRLSIV